MKAQLKIQEMAFVLLAVMLLFGLIFLFFAKFELERIRQIARETREERAVTLVRSIASMPELRCSEEVSEAACLDLEKVKAFNESASLRNSYRKFWEKNYITEITIREIVSGKVYYIYKAEKSNLTYYSFFPLCSRDECVLAMLNVGIKIS